MNSLKYQAKVIFFFLFLLFVWSLSALMFFLNYFTLFSFSVMTPSICFINYFVSLYDTSLSLRLSWFKDITSIDRFDIVFNKFLFKAYANYPLAAFLIFIISYVSFIFDFSTFTIDWYWAWICIRSSEVYLFTVFEYPSLYVKLNIKDVTFSMGKILSSINCDGILDPSRSQFFSSL